MQDKVELAFSGASANIFLACEYLEDLITEYMNSSLDNNVKEARISAVNAKINYLKGIKFDPRAYPWTKDVVDTEV
jgi:hypothetical protein